MTQVSATTPQLVSIVIATYNHGDYLGNAIDSVLAQDYAAVELIVVDDGSTDDTPTVLERYSGRERVRIMRQPNSGQANALNRGWAASVGEILSYLGADDVLEPHAVSRAVSYLSARPDAVLAYCDYLLIDPTSNVTRRVDSGDFTHEEMVSRLVCFPGPGPFFRRAAYLEAGPWSESLRQIPDFEFWLRLARVGSFLRIPEVLARYRVHEGSQSFTKVAAGRADEPILVMRSYFASTDTASSEYRWKDKSMAYAHLLSARLHFRAGRIRMGCHRAVIAVWLYPSVLLEFRTHHLLANAFLNRGLHQLMWLLNRLRGRW